MALTLEKIRAKKAQQQKALEAALKEIREQLITMGAVKIILFGSLARGPITRWSDLDIICIMPGGKTGKEWKDKIYEGIHWEVGCDLMVYTEDELEQTLPVSRFLRYALKTGKVIYESRS